MDKNSEDAIIQCHLKIEALKLEIEEEREKIREIFNAFIKRVEIEPQFSFKSFFHLIYYKLMKMRLGPEKCKIFSHVHNLYAKDTIS